MDSAVGDASVLTPGAWGPQREGDQVSIATVTLEEEEALGKEGGERSHLPPEGKEGIMGTKWKHHKDSTCVEQTTGSPVHGSSQQTVLRQGLDEPTGRKTTLAQTVGDGSLSFPGLHSSTPEPQRVGRGCGATRSQGSGPRWCRVERAFAWLLLPC